MTVLLQHTITFCFILQSFLQLTIRSFTINTIQFTVSNNGTQWILEIGPDSVALSVKVLDENLTSNSLEIPLAAWYLLLSQRQQFLDKHLPRVPITSKQQGTIEMRGEVLSSVGAQDTDTREYEVSDLEDIQFSWEGPVVDMVSAYRPGIVTPFFSSIFDGFQMGSTAANPIVVDDEEDTEISAPTTTKPESDRPTETSRLFRRRPVVTRLEKVPDFVYKTLFR